MDMNDPSEALISKAEEKLKQQEADVRATKKFINQILVFNNKLPRYPDDDPSTSIQTSFHGDEYVGKSQTTACRQILERRKAANLGPATIEELYIDLLAGGYQFDAKDAETAKRGMYQTLTRNSGIFHRLSNKKYGLTAWYPGVKDNNKKKDDDENGKDGEESKAPEAAPPAAPSPKPEEKPSKEPKKQALKASAKNTD